MMILRNSDGTFELYGNVPFYEVTKEMLLRLTDCSKYTDKELDVIIGLINRKRLMQINMN